MNLHLIFVLTFVYFVQADYTQLQYLTGYEESECVEEKRESINTIINNMRTCIVVSVSVAMQMLKQSTDHEETMINFTCAETPRRFLHCISVGSDDLLKLCESRVLEKNIPIMISAVNNMVDYACSHKQEYKETLKSTNPQEFFYRINECVPKHKGNGKALPFDKQDCEKREEMGKCVINANNNEVAKDFVKNLLLAGAKAMPCNFSFD